MMKIPSSRTDIITARRTARTANFARRDSLHLLLPLTISNAAQCTTAAGVYCLVQRHRAACTAGVFADAQHLQGPPGCSKLWIASRHRLRRTVCSCLPRQRPTETPPRRDSTSNIGTAFFQGAGWGGRAGAPGTGYRGNPSGNRQTTGSYVFRTAERWTSTSRWTRS